jgi:hypothetical protein
MTLVSFIGGVCLMMVFGLIIRIAMQPCQHCQSKKGYRWTYPRRDGGPDRRRSGNYRICKKCGAQQKG